MNVKFVADEIFKKAVPVVKPEDHMVTLQFSDMSLKSILTKIGKSNDITGFSGSSATKIQFQIPMSISPNLTDIGTFQAELKTFLQRTSFTNIRFEIVPMGTNVKPMKV